MGMTIAEKIIAAAAGVDSVKPGDIHTVQLDRLMSNDGTTHLTVDMYNNKLKNPHIADTWRIRNRCRMYRLSLWNGNRNFLGTGSGICKIQSDR